MRVYGFIIAICIILCVITITLNSNEKKLHIHHYVVGFAFAVCNVSNHPLSILVLGSAMGVMVEGLTMHGVFPTIYTPSNCGKIQNIRNFVADVAPISTHMSDAMCYYRGGISKKYQIASTHPTIRPLPTFQRDIKSHEAMTQMH